MPTDDVPGTGPLLHRATTLALARRELRFLFRGTVLVFEVDRGVFGSVRASTPGPRS